MSNVLARLLMVIKLFLGSILISLIISPCLVWASPLSVNQAFQLNAETIEGQARIVWQIKEGHYLYRDSVQFKDPHDVSVPITLPLGQAHQDPIKGEVQVYRGQLSVTLSARSHGGAVIQYQGCSDQGICYPPQHRKLYQANQKWVIAGNSTGYVASQARWLQQHSLWKLIAIFFVAGLLLSFTPCVYPMIPIVTKLLHSKDHHLSTYQAFELTSLFVLGTAVIYAFTGWVVGALGANLLILWQSTWILMVCALFFFLLGFAMLGYVHLRLPEVWQSKLDQLIRQHRYNKKIGMWLGAFVSGILSALIISPCVTPVLAGALVFISTTGEGTKGAIMLFFLAIGMGLPLMLFGAGLGKWMPKNGVFLNIIENILGWLLLAVGILLLSRVWTVGVSAWLVTVLWVIWLSAAAGYGWRQKGVIRVIGVIVGLYALIVLGAGLQGLGSPLQAWKAVSITKRTDNQFKTVYSLDALERALRGNKQNQKAVVVDVYADWCTYCQVLEQDILRREDVQKALQLHAKLRLDITNFDQGQIQQLQQKWNVFAPPVLIFIERDGIEHHSARLIGEISAADILRAVKP